VFWQKIKDMRPGALILAAAGDESKVDKAPQISAPPSPGWLSTIQLCTIVNEPCKSSPLADSIRSNLQNSIKQMKKRRLASDSIGCSRDNSESTTPISETVSLMSSPKPLNMSSKHAKNDARASNSKKSGIPDSLQKASSKSDKDPIQQLQALYASLKAEHPALSPAKRILNVGQQNNLPESLSLRQISPNFSPEHGDEIPAISRSTSPERSDNSLEHSPSKSPSSPPIVIRPQASLKSCAPGIQIADEDTWFQSDAATWIRDDDSWRQVDDSGLGEHNLSTDDLSNLVKDIERIRRKSLGSSVGKLHQHGSSSGKPPRPWRDVSAFAPEKADDDVSALISKQVEQSIGIPGTEDRMNAEKGIEQAADASVNATDSLLRLSHALLLSSSDTPSPSGSKDSDEARITQAWQLRQEAEDFTNVHRDSEEEDDLPSPLRTNIFGRSGSQESFSSTGKRRVGQASLNSSFSSVGSMTSINTFTGECIDSVVYEHNFKLMVRVMHVFKHLIAQQRIFESILGTRLQRHGRHCVKSWHDVAEQQRVNACNLHFVFRAWILSFHQVRETFEQTVSERKRRDWRQVLRAWFLRASQQLQVRQKLAHARSNNTSYFKKRFLRVWSVWASEQSTLRQKLGSVISDSKRRFKKRFLYEWSQRASEHLVLHHKLLQSLSNKKRSVKQQFLHAWSLRACEQRADSFRTEYTFFLFFFAWVDQAVENRELINCGRYILKVWRRWYVEKKGSLHDAQAAARQQRLDSIFSAWIDVAEDLGCDRRFSRQILGAWRSWKITITLRVDYCTKMEELKVCRENFIAWSNVLAQHRIHAGTTLESLCSWTRTLERLWLFEFGL